jgi:outer membrane receptor for ferrienterochelin and colicin
MKSFDGRRLLAAIAFLLLLPYAGAAQQAGTGRLTGVVKDADGAVIPGAEVVAAEEQTSADFHAFSDSTGTWSLASVPAGTYTITVTSPATVPGVLRGVAVAAGGSASADLTLMPGISETLVVTASRVEQLMVNAPAAVTIVNDRRLAMETTQNYADVMREIPGVNVVQMSARDFNVTPRAATNVPASSQLVMVDGRPINQDYYGYVAWDFIPNDLGEVKQIEVLRGAASAVWGAYAMNGVVNILTKSPREMPRGSLTIGGGTFDRTGGTASSDSGSTYYVNASAAGPINNLWSYKASGGYMKSDPFARPSGTIPNSFQTPYPAFQNFGTKQPKVDGRVDYDSASGRHHVSVAGGFAGSGGTFHTGLGPFRLDDNASGTYAKVDYRASGLSVKSFVNLWHGEATSLLARGPLGNPLFLNFDDRSWDIDAQKTHVLNARNTLTVGGNYRHNWCQITMAPGADKRNLAGGYVQDEMTISDSVRAIIGGRVDKYDVPDKVVFSPRLALMLKPAADQTVRVSYSRAYRAPSMFQNFLDTTVANGLDLGLLNPALAGTPFYFIVRGLGNIDLDEQTLDAYEVSYSASLAKGRAHAGAAVYFTNSRNDMILTQTGSYNSSNVPYGWPLPPYILDALIAGNVFGPGLGLPSVLSFVNLGEVRNKGFELSFDAQPHRYGSVFANYSWQAEPDPDFDISKINLPPTHRFNAGVGFDVQRFMGDLSVAYTSKAFFRDVLDKTYAGFTEPFTVVNLSGGVRLAGEHAVFVVKVRNVANKPVQNHLFGDLLKRQVVGELKIRM